MFELEKLAALWMSADALRATTRGAWHWLASVANYCAPLHTLVHFSGLLAKKPSGKHGKRECLKCEPDGESEKTDHLLLFDFPALLRAIATACFCGLPASTSRLMFCEMVFFEEPFLSGIC